MTSRSLDFCWMFVLKLFDKLGLVRLLRVDMLHAVWYNMFLCCSNNCKNKTLCMEKLSLVLPETPPYFPRQFDRCAVIGNSGDLLKTRFGKEIDGYDAVIRENGAPIEVLWPLNWILVTMLVSTIYECSLIFFFFDVLQNYTAYVGKKSTFRLLNRGSAKALDKVVELDGMSLHPPPPPSFC